MGDSEELREYTHDFDGEICVKCGAEFEDALRGPIGCDAGPEGNDPQYLGHALTPEQQLTGEIPDPPYFARKGNRTLTAEEFLAEISLEDFAKLPVESIAQIPAELLANLQPEFLRAWLANHRPEVHAEQLQQLPSD